MIHLFAYICGVVFLILDVCDIITMDRIYNNNPNRFIITVRGPNGSGKKTAILNFISSIHKQYMIIQCALLTPDELQQMMSRVVTRRLDNKQLFFIFNGVQELLFPNALSRWQRPAKHMPVVLVMDDVYNRSCTLAFNNIPTLNTTYDVFKRLHILKLGKDIVWAQQNAIVPNTNYIQLHTCVRELLDYGELLSQIESSKPADFFVGMKELLGSHSVTQHFVDTYTAIKILQSILATIPTMKLSTDILGSMDILDNVIQSVSDMDDRIWDNRWTSDIFILLLHRLPTEIVHTKIGVPTKMTDIHGSTIQLLTHQTMASIGYIPSTMELIERKCLELDICRLKKKREWLSFDINDTADTTIVTKRPTLNSSFMK